MEDRRAARRRRATLFLSPMGCNRRRSAAFFGLLALPTGLRGPGVTSAGGFYWPKTMAYPSITSLAP